MLKIDLFGPLRLRTSHRELGAQDFQGAKPKQVLEILATAAGHRVSKESLADRLWGETPPPKYLATLETYVSLLRHTIQPAVRASDSLIVTEPGGYRLDSRGVELDLDRFDALLLDAGGAVPSAALQSLESALALVRGKVLEDEPYAEWADELRSTYHPRQLQALVSAGELSLLAGDATAALARAEAAVELNPLSEGAYQVQMTAAYALWRQDEALAAFDRCRRLLGDELGVSPLDKTVALHLAILRHEDLASMLPRVTPSGTDASARGARVAKAGQPHKPEMLAREHELAQIGEAVERARDGQFTLVLVTGETGMGKTSLVEAATKMATLPVGSNRCSDLEQGLPYLALAMALRSMPDGPSDGLPVLKALLAASEQQVPFDDFARLRVMELLAAWLGSQQPFVLVLDDVQWADAETLRTISYLRRRCATAPIVILLTCDRAALSNSAVRGLQPDVRIDLRELPADALQDEELFAATGGHPLFVAGWSLARARGLVEPFPPEVCERVVMSCWDLGPQAFQLLSVSCVLEQPFAPDLLAALVGTAPPCVAEQLDHLVDRRVLDAVDNGFRFRSPAVRVILANTVSSARRSMLQRAAAVFPARRKTDGEAGVAVAPLQRRATDSSAYGSPWSVASAAARHHEAGHRVLGSPTSQDVAATTSRPKASSPVSVSARV